MVDIQIKLNNIYQKTIPKTRPPREKFEQHHFNFQPPDLVIFFNRFKSRSKHY